MTRLHVKLDETLITPRKHGQLMKLLLRESMAFQRDINLDRHFQVGAESRYGYAKRGKRYMIRKAKKYGHQKPLVFSGRMQRDLKSSVRITATQHRATLKARNYFPMTLERRAEIEAITKDEEAHIAARLHRRYAALVRTPTFQRKRRRKG